jgi:hypothetical protein
VERPEYIVKKTKKSLGRCLVEGVMMYGSELWVENKSKKATAVEMYYLLRSARKSKLERVPN